MAMRWEGFMAGANLGHWISQYEGRGKEHFDNYIIASDFDQMRSWGLDHVRLPVDYPLFERDDAPGQYLEEGLHYIDWALEQCRRNGLNLVLDLHKTPGFFFFDNKEAGKNDLFNSPAKQERFLNIWRMFAKRYAGEGDNLAFELLNELVCEDSAPWNALWPKAVAAIREISPKRKIVVGSNRWNSVDELKNLTLTDDPNVIYNFHCYAPIVFTHQRAGWEDWLVSYQTSVVYPVPVEEHRVFLEKHNPTFLEKYKVIDRAAMADILRPAAEFIAAHQRPLYCGEYGVIANADLGSTVRWLDDITSIFNELGIGHAVWSYRGFAKVTDANRRPVCPGVIAAISRH
uniref:Cellulase n=1 Tax=uncultured microorganism TaxID=358574 RepID=B1PLK8_9ZZZZ|nr:cellulase [uncultured microorganism]